MNGKIGGQRPRPRVALIGTFNDEDIEHFNHMFPTVWSAPDIWTLKDLVDIREIDLIVIAPGIEGASDWPEKTHVICFSEEIGRLPGPLRNSYLQISGTAETEEYLFRSGPGSLPISFTYRVRIAWTGIQCAWVLVDGNE